MKPVAAESVIASANVWKASKRTPEPGQVRHKMWRYLLPPVAAWAHVGAPGTMLASK